MKEKNEKGSEQDLSDIARDRPKLEGAEYNDIGPPGQDPRERSTGSKILRGCGIALGIAVLLVMFVFGACMMSFR